MLCWWKKLIMTLVYVGVWQVWRNIYMAYGDRPDLMELAESLSRNFESLYEKQVSVSPSVFFSSLHLLVRSFIFYLLNMLTAVEASIGYYVLDFGEWLLFQSFTIFKLLLIQRYVSWTSVGPSAFYFEWVLVDGSQKLLQRLSWVQQDFLSLIVFKYTRFLKSAVDTTEF